MLIFLLTIIGDTSTMSDTNNTCYGTMILFTIVLIASFAIISIYYPSARNIKETMKDEGYLNDYQDGGANRKGIHQDIVKRAKGILLACMDTTDSLLYNSTDMSAAYSIWSSQMLKRGLHEIYITPTVFETCMEAKLNDYLDIRITMEIVKSKIDQELVMKRKRCIAHKPQPIKPFCMNY